METYDVIIVGAGPAGISTALHLQQIAPDLASRTLVLEKARHPRPKICAGGILPDGFRLLTGLGMDIREVPTVSVNCVHFGFEDKGLTAEEDKEREPFHFYTVLRDDFDAWLAAGARERGIQVLEESPVQQILPGSGGVDVVTPAATYRAKVVVGADGAHSVVRKAIAGGRKPRYARAILVWAPPPPLPSHRERGVYFDFQCVPRGIPGYIWDFPVQVRGQQMRCWGVYDSNAVPVRARKRPQPILTERLAHYGYREEFPLYGGAIHHFYPDNVFSAPRVLLVGDAAGVDLLFGEGISPALGYGKIAARAIADAFARNDFSFRDYRERVVRSSMGGVLSRRLWIASLLYRIRSSALQRLIWWQFREAIRWSIRRMMYWADRLE